MQCIDSLTGRVKLGIQQKITNFWGKSTKQDNAWRDQVVKCWFVFILVFVFEIFVVFCNSCGGLRGVEWSNAELRRNSTNLACYPTHHHHLSSALAESSSSPKHLGLETTRCRNGMETSWKIRQDKRGFKRGQIWKTNKHEKHLMTKDKNINLHQSWKKKTNYLKQFAK